MLLLFAKFSMSHGEGKNFVIEISRAGLAEQQRFFINE